MDELMKNNVTEYRDGSNVTEYRDGTETAELSVVGMSCGSCVDRIRGALAGAPGIESLEVELGRVRIEFFPQAVSIDALRKKIEALGYAVPMPTESRNPFRRFLDRMIKSNQETFGNQRLDCCTMKKG